MQASNWVRTRPQTVQPVTGRKVYPAAAGVVLRVERNAAEYMMLLVMNPVEARQVAAELVRVANLLEGKE